MARLGADVAQLDQLAQRFEREARRMGTVGRRTTATLGEVWWQGDDAERTRTWWKDHGARQLHDAADWLDGLSTQLRQQADHQRTASEAGGGGGGGGGAGPDPAGWLEDRVRDAGEWIDDHRDDVGEGAERFVDALAWLGEAMSSDGGGDDVGGFSLTGVAKGIAGGGGDLLGGARDLGGAVIDRGTTAAEYGLETGWRRVTNPVQTVVDATTFTTYAEDLAAMQAILGEDAEIVDDHDYEGQAIVLDGASAPDGADAITIGHTIRAPDGLSGDLLDHEMQHVFDIEDVGGLGFYGSYGFDYGWNRLIEGQGHDDAYRDIWWEQRAYGLDGDPEGIFGGIWKGDWFR